MDESYCEHKNLEVTQLALKVDGVTYYRASCPDCGQEAVEPLLVEYSPFYKLIGSYVLPIVAKRGNLSSCASCNRLMFPDLAQVPVISFVTREGDPQPIGELDLCPECAGFLLPRMAERS
jgi:hypothetical protein